MIGKLMTLLGLRRKEDSTAIDPVCRMVVEKANPGGGTSAYQGITYYFCAPGCRRAFDEDQEKHLD